MSKCSFKSRTCCWCTFGFCNETLRVSLKTAFLGLWQHLVTLPLFVFQFMAWVIVEHQNMLSKKILIFFHFHCGRRLKLHLLPLACRTTPRAPHGRWEYFQGSPSTWSKRVEGCTGTEQKGYLRNATNLHKNTASAQKTSYAYVS